MYCADNRGIKFGSLKLINRSGKALLGERVSIIQHPQGNTKQIAIRENEVIDIFSDFIHYSTDTQPGSSGSPVFNDQWQVVGLHHAGVIQRDEQFVPNDKSAFRTRADIFLRTNELPNSQSGVVARFNESLLKPRSRRELAATN